VDAVAAGAAASTTAASAAGEGAADGAMEARSAWLVEVHAPGSAARRGTRIDLSCMMLGKPFE
jgi:hypothetical protein